MAGGHLGGARAPQVNAGAEADGEHVQRGPVDQVKVEVILWRGGGAGLSYSRKEAWCLSGREPRLCA